MELIQGPGPQPAPVRIDYGLPVIDFGSVDGDWPFMDNRVEVLRGTAYIDSQGRIQDADDLYFSVSGTDGDSVLGHLTDGRRFVSSRDGVTAFEARMARQQSS